MNRQADELYEVFFKLNNDTLYCDEDDRLTPIGETLFANIKKTLRDNADSIEPYAQYFDKSYLFLSIGESTYWYELF